MMCAISPGEDTCQVNIDLSIDNNIASTYQLFLFLTPLKTTNAYLLDHSLLRARNAYLESFWHTRQTSCSSWYKSLLPKIWQPPSSVAGTGASDVPIAPGNRHTWHPPSFAATGTCLPRSILRSFCFLNSHSFVKIGYLSNFDFKF